MKKHLLLFDKDPTLRRNPMNPPNLRIPGTLLPLNKPQTLIKLPSYNPTLRKKVNAAFPYLYHQVALPPLNKSPTPPTLPLPRAADMH